MSKPIDVESFAVHRTHCCVKHGCKYSEPGRVCPVEIGAIKQDYPCEQCQYDVETLAEFSTEDLLAALQRRNFTNNTEFKAKADTMLTRTVIKSPWKSTPL